jgi:hypothetical protein
LPQTEKAPHANAYGAFSENNKALFLGRKSTGDVLDNLTDGVQNIANKIRRCFDKRLNNLTCGLESEVYQFKLLLGKRSDSLQNVV